MKHLLFITTVILFACSAYGQTGRSIHGSLTDSTKVPVTGSSIKLQTEKGDSSFTTADAKGSFVFNNVSGIKITLTITSIGYQTLKRHYVLDDDNKQASLGTIVLKQQQNMLNQVNIVAVIPVTIKEDTIEYKASAYKVRDNAPVEDMIRKLPGVDVDASGNIIAQGKQVNKVRVNGKDFFGGDVKTATQNLPADIVENIQMIDDYGDQANITGVKTGEPDKIMNINIRKDKNYGYTGQITGGDGADALPANPGVTNSNRYVGLLNAFDFNGNQQIALLGNMNNTNVNTFSFGTPSMSPGGSNSVLDNKKIALDAMSSGGGNKISIAGGIKLSVGGGGNFTGQASQQNGITDTHSLGANFRDQWGKYLSVYGSYSFADNTVFTKTSTYQQNTSLTDPGSSTQDNNETDRNINHRITWNMEYKPDTTNYLKVTPTFSYGSTNGNSTGNVMAERAGVENAAYSSVAQSKSSSPNYGFTALYNHRFKGQGRNFAATFSINSSTSNEYQNLNYNSVLVNGTVPANQLLNTKASTTAIGTNLSYMEPLGMHSFLEFNYTFNHSATTNNKGADVLDTVSHAFIRDSALSNQCHYTFITNRFDLNYRYIQKAKYNFTLGLGVEPTVLDGASPLTGLSTHVSTFNIIPTAHFVYSFSRSSSFSVNYSGESSQPNFSQLQPVTDFSNALYPIEGNPGLKPSFTSSYSVRYNQFDFNSGNTLFANLSFTQTQNQVVTNTIAYPAVYKPNPLFENAYLTQYINANGFYSSSAYFSYAKPWDNRKYTLMFNGAVAYNNNIGYLTTVDPVTYDETTEKNTAKNLVITPGVRFRLDLPDLIDAQFLTNYSINKTDNSIKNSFTNASSDIRTWNTGVSGKNYFHDWTLSYEYSKAVNYGYAPTVNATNPNIFNFYAERRFMKGHRATVRLAAYDIFNQNTGFSSNTNASSVTQTNTNRLGRYFLATFTLRLQKFAGK